MNRCYCSVLAVVAWALTLLNCHTMVAQADTSPVVSGAGTVLVEHQADTVRLSIQLSEKAPTIKEALAKLGDRSDAATLQLESLGAAKETIKLTGASIAGASPQQVQMQQMMIRQFRNQGREVPPGLTAPKSTAVRQTLTADWPLTGTHVERLIMSNKIAKAVKDADLAGLKEPKELTPEEEELQEELEAMQNEYGGYADDGQQKVGEPLFIYVGTIRDEQRTKAVSEAFAKAKTQASQLANAAGAKLGELKSLRSNQNNEIGAYDYRSYGGFTQFLQSPRQPNENEVIAPVLEGLQFMVSVTATFALE